MGKLYTDCHEYFAEQRELAEKAKAKTGRRVGWIVAVVATLLIIGLISAVTVAVGALIAMP
jgi:membrane protein YqaA with SNARE-associated domain